MKIVVETEVIAIASLVFNIEESKVESFITSLSEGVTPLQMLEEDSFEQMESLTRKRFHRDTHCVRVMSEGKILWSSGDTYVK